MRSVVLYFGSFNPVHEGHTSIARWSAQTLGETWMVVSPANPLRDDLAPEQDRLEMAKIAVRERLEGLPVSVSDVEFGLPRPSYTIDTLRFLEREYPSYGFSILIGEDIVAQLPRWKESEKLREHYEIHVYPRVDGSSSEDMPIYNFSSTDVREKLLSGEDVSRMVCPGVAEYIERHGLWQPVSAEGWMTRGRRMQRHGKMGEALSAFLRAAELEPANKEAAERIKMLREIFSFHYVDYYNP